jgi:hypothetical protein
MEDAVVSSCDGEPPGEHGSTRRQLKDAATPTPPDPSLINQTRNMIQSPPPPAERFGFEAFGWNSMRQ